ncbi:E3 ubiquitin-protein ligase RNF13 [Microplitis demolitor]|uniref:E3 ubiquitin-protein ligase RNF13 n=1 Tax=Microplitis demolitor TaxID=69319 RepID=UPI0004CD4DAE|nr:E3 ubiquitin-protein ligase RNF13 [Microplitis demolitor]
MLSYCCSTSRRVLLCLTLSTMAANIYGDILVFSDTSQHQIEEEFRDIPARFGPLIPVEGIRGKVVYAQPPTGCRLISPPPNDANYTGLWIALIARYNCSFEIKVRMAQKAGYDAVIVHNVNSNELEPMSAKEPLGISIPSVFVSQITGLIIKENYLWDNDFSVLINDDIPFNINTHLLLPFAIVVGICFLVMVIFMVVRCIKDRRRQRRHRLPKSSLKKIPTHKYTKGDPYETCAICLDDYVENEKLRVLPCAHAYHTKCIDPWLTKNKRVCPVCKRKVFAADERIITDSESDSDADDSTPLIRDGHQGTQGGTFTPQRENPFTRALRSQQRRHSNSSNSSDDSFRSLITSGGSRSSHNGETSGNTTFLVSDTHSINGEPSDFERSTDSNDTYTVTVCSVDAEEHPASVVHISQSQSESAAQVPPTTFAPVNNHPFNKLRDMLTRKNDVLD